LHPANPRPGSPLAAIALALLACLLAVSTWHVFNATWDEPEHLAAGLVLLEHGVYAYDDQHPPLARLAAAIGPHLAGAHLDKPWPIQGVAAGRQVLYHSGVSPDTVLALARLGMLPFLLVLMLATWQWVRRWFDGGTATLAALFVLTTPVVLGHAAVAALDVPVSGLIILSLYLLLRWQEQPSPARAAGFGFAAGLATATKLSAVPFIGVCAVVLAVARIACLKAAPRSWRWRERIGGLALAAVIIVVITVGLYGPHIVTLAIPPLPSWRVPLGVNEVMRNFLGVAWHNAHGHPAYLLGETGLYGWWYFYPVALAVRTPLPLLCFGLGGLGLLLRRGVRECSVPLLAPGLCFLAILGFSCLYSRINIGVRHVLVLYPLLAIGAAYAVMTAWRAAAGIVRERSRRIAHVSLIVIMTWQVGTLLVWPDYLAYFNAFAGDHPERILVDSDLDWGQDLRRLSHELARRHVPSLHLAYSGSADPALEHLPPVKPLLRDTPVSGWVAISMLALKDNRPHYDWLLQYQPVTRVGKSIDLYYIDSQRR
jgi:hypothetical protein